MNDDQAMIALREELRRQDVELANAKAAAQGARDGDAVAVPRALLEELEAACEVTPLHASAPLPFGLRV
jgi:hypothetical protein